MAGGRIRTQAPASCLSACTDAGTAGTQFSGGDGRGHLLLHILSPGDTRPPTRMAAGPAGKLQQEGADGCGVQGAEGTVRAERGGGGR